MALEPFDGDCTFVFIFVRKIPFYRIMDEDPDFDHKVYKNDPLVFKSYVGMEVKISAVGNTMVSGIVYTVDPVSESVVLLQGPERNHLKIVLGHAIKSIEVCSDKPCELPELFTNSEMNILQQSTLEERKRSVIKLLRENRFSIKEENNILTIENVLSIKPPYEPADCICANSIILGRIQNLLVSRVQL